ncbi:MAG: thiamine-phosphate kinase [Amphritea sp.]
MGEFELIKQYFSALGRDSSGTILLGVGDDCALIAPPADRELVVSIDTMVEGVHFPAGTSAERIATRLLGAALSDLAAMAAEPGFFTLALTLPESDSQWLAAFARALAESANQHGVRLVGGDTTRGPLTLSVQVHGWTKPGCALQRSGARPGDHVYVTGTLGDSRGGLETILNDTLPSHDVEVLQQRFYAPQPRLSTAALFAEFATAAIDISDGLLADLGHILEQSGVGALLNIDELPISQSLHCWAGESQSREWALSGGEDFEICFTAPAHLEPKLAWALRGHEVAVTCIGQITEEQSLLLSEEGRVYPAVASGYNHFKSDKETS